MSLMSVVPGKREFDAEKFAPCGHTWEQASWLGCTAGVCRYIDEQLTREYNSWVKAGRPGAQGR